MELALPSAEYKDSYIAAVKEFKNDPHHTARGKKYLEASIDDLKNNFAGHVEKILATSRGEGLPDGYVPQTEYWLVDGGEYIGCVSIRHYLTPQLMEIGGHIGYDIRPSKRGKGYGTQLLQLALSKAGDLGVDKLLITCDETNIASRKIIEGAGGVLEDIRDTKEGKKRRYWVEL